MCVYLKYTYQTYTHINQYFKDVHLHACIYNATDSRSISAIFSVLFLADILFRGLLAKDLDEIVLECGKCGIPRGQCGKSDVPLGSLKCILCREKCNDCKVQQSFNRTKDYGDYKVILTLSLFLFQKKNQILHSFEIFPLIR